jgi:hypothetical protein
MSTHATASSDLGATADTSRALQAPAAIAGVVFLVLIVVHAQLRSEAPAASDSARAIFTYVAEHHARLQLSAVALGVAMPAVLVWFSSLHRALRTAGTDGSSAATTAFAGALLAAAGTVTGALVQGTTATRFADLGAGGTRVFWTMFLLSTGATLLGLVLLIGTTAFVSARARIFAPWFTTMSVLLALASLAGAFTIGYASDAAQIVAGVAVVLDGVWFVVLSVLLWRGPRRAGPA